MTLLAEKRHSYTEQIFNVGPVRRMAVDAIVLHRLVFIHKRPPFLGVTQETGIVHRTHDERRGTVRTVRVVAIRARHCALPDGMPVRFVDLHFFFQVAVETNFRLGQVIQHGICAGMDGVARHTTQFLGGMRTASPIDVVPLMTVQAYPALSLRARLGLHAETHTGNITWEHGVFLAGAVTGFTGIIGGRASKVSHDKVRRFEHRADFDVAVALQACLLAALQ